MADAIATEDVPLHAGGYDFAVRVYPATEPDGTVLVWMHGGAFIFGDLDMPEADDVARNLAARGTTVVSVDYTLSSLEPIAILPRPDGMPEPEALMRTDRPRAAYPVASLQVVAAFDWAREHAGRYGGDADLVAIGGASAGGNLAAGAAVRLRDRGEAKPIGQVLIYPLVHAELPEPDEDLSAALAAMPPALRFPPEVTRALNANYLGDAAADERCAFPGGHDVRGVAPALIVSADHDELRPSAEAYAGDLVRGGVDVSYVREPQIIHGFLNMPHEPAATRTHDRIAAFLAACSKGIDA